MLRDVIFWLMCIMFKVLPDENKNKIDKNENLFNIISVLSVEYKLSLKMYYRNSNV